MKRLLFILLLITNVNGVFSQDLRYKLELAYGDVFLPENFEYFLKNKELSKDELNQNQIYRFVQFYKTPDFEQQERLKQMGVDLMHYCSKHAYLVSVDRDFEWSKLKPFQVRSVSKIEADWKMSRLVREPPFPTYAKVGNDKVEVLLKWYNNIDNNTALAFLQKEKVEITARYLSENYVYAIVQIADLQQLASKNFVYHIDLVPMPGVAEDQDSRTLHNANSLDDELGLGLRLNGEGVNVLVRDDGIIGPHIDFKNRVINLAKGIGTVEHGDQVSGVLGGSGNLDPLKKGIATGTQIFTLDYEATFTDRTIPLHLNSNVVVTNTSYSDGCNAYTPRSQTIDNQLFKNKKLTHVFSAGNNGQGTCTYGNLPIWGTITGGHKQAKNCIAVANIGADLVANSTSSHGPASDGRIKPDIAAHGTNVNATMPNNKYAVNTGTSFSAPATAGVLAIMYQAYRLKNGGNDPDAVLMKNYLLNTANDFGNAGPDYTFGFGNVNTKRAVEAIENQWFMSGIVSQGKKQTFDMSAPDPTKSYKQVKVMLNWDEPEALVSAKRALINDLDFVIKKDSISYLTWVLDETPAVKNITAPARLGRDSLNNVEQIVINNPKGKYKLEVLGTNVPLGKQNFYLTFDWIEDDLKLTYPTGNEVFIPSETVRVRWESPSKDAVNQVEISYSADGGTTWATPQNALITKQFFDYKLPATATAKGKFRVVYQNETRTSQLPITVLAQPKSLFVDKVCPDSVTLKWTVAPNVNRYTVLQLGKRYMDSVTTAFGSSATFKIKSDFFKEENWFSLRPTDSLGIAKGRRINAVTYSGGLLDCPQKFDLSLEKIKRGNATNSYYSHCGTLTDSVGISLQNKGVSVAKNILVAYQIDNEPIISEKIQDTLKSGQNLNYIFPQKITFDGVGKKQLKVWAKINDDIFTYNDTLVTELKYSCQNLEKNVLPSTYAENFDQNSSDLPNGWILGNPDGKNTFAPFTVNGIDGKSTTAMVMDCSNSPLNQKDYLYSPLIQIPDSVENLKLLFDVAIANSGLAANVTAFDNLKVFAYEECTHQNGVQIYNNQGFELMTTTTNFNLWIPTEKNQWKTEVVDIKSLKGKKVYFGFQATSAAKGLIYFDNFRIKPFEYETPIAKFKLDTLEICQDGTVTFNVENPISTINYYWNFTNGTPSTGSGPGPITVVYTGATPTQRLVQVKARNNAGTEDTFSATMTVNPSPFVSFTSTKVANVVTFSNLSTNATSYLWSFGDGTNGTEQNPVHTYLKTGSYVVTLTCINDCKKVTTTRTVNISTIAVNDIFEKLSASISPNPNQGFFELNIDNQRVKNIDLEISDVLGKIIFKKKTTLDIGSQKIPIELPAVSKGVYLVKIYTEKESGVLKFMVE